MAKAFTLDISLFIPFYIHIYIYFSPLARARLHLSSPLPPAVPNFFDWKISLHHKRVPSRLSVSLCLCLFPSHNKGNSHRSTPLHYNRSVHIIMHDNNRRGLLIWVPRVLCLFVCFRQREREAWPYSFLLPSLVRILWIDNRYVEDTGILCRAG